MLEKDVFEIVHLVRSWKSGAAPINRIPPEILALIPDFWRPPTRDRDLIALTHVCRAWRGAFISWSALWTDLDGVSVDKAKVYLERSKSYPIDLSLSGNKGPVFCDAFFGIILRAIRRLRSLTFNGTQNYLDNISTHLSCPVPLLECLSIAGPNCYWYPVLTSAHFGGDLPSLRMLCLEWIRTELPWRTMVGLTSLKLVDISSVSVGQLLDFFESAPRLCNVELLSATSTPDVQNGRLVSLACRKKMYIDDGRLFPLLDHLLIPVGARLTTSVAVSARPIEDHPPRFLANLKNLHDFRRIRLSGCQSGTVRFSGPNGVVTMIHSGADYVTLSFLEYFDTSKTRRLGIYDGRSLFYRALLPMKDLRTLMLTGCVTPITFVRALHPGMSPSGVVVCPKLEELVIEDWRELVMDDIIGMAAARESRGVRLKLVRIVCPVQVDVLELEKHVSRVEYDPKESGPTMTVMVAMRKIDGRLRLKLLEFLTWLIPS